MSQSGYTPIQLYRTTTASATPAAGNLSAGELAINLTDEKLFFKNASGTVKVLASTGAGNAGGSNTQVQYNSSGVLTGSSSFVFDGTSVGIGTSSPGQKLDVTTSGGDDGIALNNSSTTGGRIRLNSTGTGGRNYHISSTANGSGDGGGKFVIRDSTAADAARLTINSSGNVGIGTSSPGSLLDVNGNTAIRGTAYFGSSLHGNVASDSNTLYLRGTNIAFQDAAGSGTYAYINSSGVLTVGGAPVAIGFQTTGQQVISTSTALTSASNAGTNILVISSGITITLPTSAVTGKTITISNISGGNITLSYTGSAGTDGPTTLSAGTSLMLISDGGSPPFWRMYLPFGGFDGTTLFESGYKDVPINQRTSTYTLALTDRGKNVFATAGSFTITVPTNASVPFPIGTAISIFCGDATKTLAPASGVTLIQAGTSNTGTRSLSINALVTLIKLQTDTWVVSGAGLS